MSLNLGGIKEGHTAYPVVFVLKLSGVVGCRLGNDLLKQIIFGVLEGFKQYSVEGGHWGGINRVENKASMKWYMDGPGQG